MSGIAHHKPVLAIEYMPSEQDVGWGGPVPGSLWGRPEDGTNLTLQGTARKALRMKSRTSIHKGPLSCLHTAALVLTLIVSSTSMFNLQHVL